MTLRRLLFFQCFKNHIQLDEPLIYTDKRQPKCLCKNLISTPKVKQKQLFTCFLFNKKPTKINK